MARQEHELHEQIALFFFRDRYQDSYPALRWFHSSLNGAHLSNSQRVKMSNSGMTSGIPDAFLPVVRWSETGKTMVFAGLFIELKVKPNKQTETQASFQRAAEQQGYLYVLAYSWQDAAEAILDYLRIEDPASAPRQFIARNRKAVAAQ